MALEERAYGEHVMPSDVLTRDASEQSGALGQRYRDAYLVARTTVGAGSVMKTLAVVVVVIVGLGSVLIAAQLTDEAQQLLLIGVAATVSVVTGFCLFILGILVTASGQLLMATIDVAVNTSPLLSNDQRERVMALPRSRRS